MFESSTEDPKETSMRKERKSDRTQEREHERLHNILSQRLIKYIILNVKLKGAKFFKSGS